MLGAALFLIEPSKAQFHLSLVASFEAAGFEIDRYEACQPLVLEPEIEVESCLPIGSRNLGSVQSLQCPTEQHRFQGEHEECVR